MGWFPGYSKSSIKCVKIVRKRFMQFVSARISLVRLGNCLQNGGILFSCSPLPRTQIMWKVRSENKFDRIRVICHWKSLMAQLKRVNFFLYFISKIYHKNVCFVFSGFLRILRYLCSSRGKMSDALSESFFDTSLTTDLLRIPVVTSLLFFIYICLVRSLHISRT